ncbi:MAG TPA: protein-glutamate O-methyltransferase CheR, partial [Desulfobacterales bacterium]|nr:protein-glutamate O-methyltransferase CheR [Desulfobacterales bacterium]
MNHPPVSHDVRALARRIHERTGWELPESRLRELSRAAAGVGEVSDRKLETIIETLCVGETYFFRDRALYHALATAILPEVIVAHAGGARAISIWSAGCATGEEPYSLATILRGCQGAAEPGGQPVLATDLSATFLARAREGVYGKNSFRTVTAEMRRKHLLEHGPGRWRVMPEVKAMVRFARLNLVRDLFPTGVDLVVCQNVLMYFTRACARQVIEGFARSLRPGGWLVT